MPIANPTVSMNLMAVQFSPFLLILFPIVFTWFLLNKSESSRVIIYIYYVELDTKVFNKLLESCGVNRFAQKGHGLPFQIWKSLRSAFAIE